MNEDLHARLVKMPGTADWIKSKLHKEKVAEYRSGIYKSAAEQIMYHASPVQDIKKFRKSEDTSGNNKGKVIFASPDKSFAAAFGSKWHDGSAVLSVEQKGNHSQPLQTSNFEKVVLKVTSDVNLDDPASIYKLKGDFKNLRHKDDIEKYTDKPVKIIEEEKFDSFKDLAKEYGVEVRKVGPKAIEEATKTRKSYSIEKGASDEDAMDTDGKIPALEKAFTDPIEKKVAYMIATSHEYKKPNVEAALSFVKNYKWELGECKLKNMQGINKPIDEAKVADMVKNMKKVNPFVVVNQLHGIRPQTPGKKMLIDGHHRHLAMVRQGKETAPIYNGTYTGAAEKSSKELREKVAKYKDGIYKQAEAKKFVKEDALSALKTLGVDLSKEKFTLDSLIDGLNVELEHGTVRALTNITDDKLIPTSKIAIAHLKESNDYYRKLDKMEATFGKEASRKARKYITVKGLARYMKGRLKPGDPGIKEGIKKGINICK